MHNSVDVPLGATRVVANPGGYNAAENPDYDPTLCVDNGKRRVNPQSVTGVSNVIAIDRCGKSKTDDATRGNHENAALSWLEDKLEGSPELPYGWLRTIGPDTYPRWHAALARMPLAIT